MRTRFFRLVVCSAAFAGCVTFVMARGGATTNAAPASEAAAPSVPDNPAPATVFMLVAASDLATGARIGPGDLAVMALLPAAAPPDALTDTAEHRAYLEGRSVLRDVPRLSPIRPADASLLPDPVTPARLVRANMRAIAIPVTPESAVAGLVAPGDHVDVILTFRLEDGTGGSRAILRNTRVLATDQAVERSDAAPAEPPRTMTLEVTPEAATALALAADLGKLSVTLSGDAPSDAPESELLSLPPMVAAEVLALGTPDRAPEPDSTVAPPATLAAPQPVTIAVSIVRGSVVATAQVLPAAARSADPVVPPAPAEE